MSLFIKWQEASKAVQDAERALATVQTQRAEIGRNLMKALRPKALAALKAFGVSDYYLTGDGSVEIMMNLNPCQDGFTFNAMLYAEGECTWDHAHVLHYNLATKTATVRD